VAEIRVITPQHAPDDDVLESWQRFADSADEAGWTLAVEWLDPWTDPETGYEYPGRFHWCIFHEEMCSDGKVHAYFLDVPEITPAMPSAWEATLDHAGYGWRAYLERAGVDVA
jgi:hypothetical protein